MNIFNKIISYTEHFHTSWRRDPERDWIGLITLSAIVLTGIIIWNMWTFDIVANGGVIGSAATSSPTTFNRSSMDAINDVFDKRAAEEIRYRTGVYHYSDPSQ